MHGSPIPCRMAKGFSADNLQRFYMTNFYDVKILVSIVTATCAGTYPNSGDTLQKTWRIKIPVCPGNCCTSAGCFQGKHSCSL